MDMTKFAAEGATVEVAETLLCQELGRPSCHGTTGPISWLRMHAGRRPVGGFNAVFSASFLK